MCGPDSGRLVGREGLWLQLAPLRRVGRTALSPLPVSRGISQASSLFSEHVAAAQQSRVLPTWASTPTAVGAWTRRVPAVCPPSPRPPRAPQRPVHCPPPRLPGCGPPPPSPAALAPQGPWCLLRPMGQSRHLPRAPQRRLPALGPARSARRSAAPASRGEGQHRAAPAGGHALLVADVAPAPAAPGPPPALSQRAPQPARPQAPLCVRPPGHAWCPSGFPPLGSHGPFLEAADVPTGGPVCGFSHSLACHQDPLPSRAPLCPLWARASLPGASCP